MYLKGIFVLSFVAVCAWAIPLDSKPNSSPPVPASASAENGTSTTTTKAPIVRRGSDEMKPVLDEKNKTLNATEHKIKEREAEHKLEDDKAALPLNGSSTTTTTTTKKPVRRDAEHKLENNATNALNGSTTTTKKPMRREAEHKLQDPLDANTTTTTKKPMRREAEHKLENNATQADLKLDEIFKELNSSSPASEKNETLPKKNLKERAAEDKLAGNFTLAGGKNATEPKKVERDAEQSLASNDNKTMTGGEVALDMTMLGDDDGELDDDDDDDDDDKKVQPKDRVYTTIHRTTTAAPGENETSSTPTASMN